MQLKSACAYTNFSFISVQNYNSTKIRPFLYAADDIFAKRNNPIIVSQVQKIIENEAPISKTLLGKKIISEWGVNRVGPRIDAQLEIIFDTLHLYRIEHDGLIFCWKDEAQYRSYSEYRPDSDRLYVHILAERVQRLSLKTGNTSPPRILPTTCTPSATPLKASIPANGLRPASARAGRLPCSTALSIRTMWIFPCLM